MALKMRLMPTRKTPATVTRTIQALATYTNFCLLTTRNYKTSQNRTPIIKITDGSIFQQQFWHALKNSTPNLKLSRAHV